MAVMAVLIVVGSVLGLATQVTPLMRAATHGMNRLWPNEVLDPGSAIAVKRRRLDEDFDFPDELKAQGFDEGRQDLLYRLSQRLLDITELIALYRRGKIETEEALYAEADKVGWSQPDVDYMLRVTEVIPSAGDIIRYAVREVYTPEIAEAFGQFDELPDVLELAKDDLKAAGLPEDTFRKEWAAHWMLPSTLQGFEMLHRGVIPFDTADPTGLSLKRLMIALDIMPAWRAPLRAISYNPFTRVDVRRMHKAGVLDDEAVFIAYADVGFSPLAEGHEHDSVAEAFRCSVCRHESKCGRMLDFTIAYNYDPPDEEKTVTDKERDLTKSDILTGLRDGLLEESDVRAALGGLGYDSDEVDYYVAKVEYQRAQQELNDSLSYLHDAYIKRVIQFDEVTDELGKLNLPAKMTEYYLKTWDLEKIARTNKPTKSELMTFLRKGVIKLPVWRTEMAGLGYTERYIDWYAAGESEAS